MLITSNNNTALERNDVSGEPSLSTNSIEQQITHESYLNRHGCECLQSSFNNEVHGRINRKAALTHLGYSRNFQLVMQAEGPRNCLQHHVLLTVSLFYLTTTGSNMLSDPSTR